MKGWLITDYAQEQTVEVTREGGNVSHRVTRTSAVRTRVNPETGERVTETWTSATDWVAEGGDAA